MTRAGRFVSRLLLAGALGTGAYLAWVATVGSPAPVDLLPSGAAGVVTVHGAEELSQRLSGTRFAALFAQSSTRQWLERTEAVVAFDSVLAEIRSISGISPGRGSAFDLLGAEVAVGWYPGAAVSPSAAVPWVGGGRLSLRGWAVAWAMRLGRRLGLGASNIVREETEGRVLYAVPVGGGQSLYGFLAGRVLVCGPDRTLVLQAARAAGNPDAAVTREPAWRTIQGGLPPDGDLFVWLRDRSAVPGAFFASEPERASHGSIGARLRAGNTIEIDIVAEPSAKPVSATAAGGTPTPLPGGSLLTMKPLFSLTSRTSIPAALTDLLNNRQRDVARRSAGTAEKKGTIEPTGGFALVITDSASGKGFFPLPQGLLMIGMASASEAAQALPLLYPPGARTGAGGGTQALATRESIPLAGEFELWGAAIGRDLVFATNTSLLDAAAADANTVASRQPADPSWQVDTAVTISMVKALPLLQRWSAPLSGLIAANWPEAPDLLRDLRLLAAVDTVRLAAGSDARFERAAVTVTVHDVP